jgi:uncharacterized protein involved in exopolysaccharide biosynthesis
LATEILISDLIVLAKKQILYLARRKWAILFASLVSGLMSVSLFLLIEKKYKAEITLINENDSQNKLGSYSSIAELVGVDVGTSTTNSFKGDNILDLLKSRRMIETVLESNYQLNTTFLEAYLMNHSIKYHGKLSPTDSSFKRIRLRDSLYNLVSDRIIKKQISTRKIDKKTDLLKVEFEDIDENYAFSFLNRLVANTQAFYTDYKTKKTKENVDIFQSQLDSVKLLLFKSIDAIAQKQDDALNINKAKAKIPAQQKQIQQQANAALYVELVKNLELSKISLLKEKPFIQIIDVSKQPLQSNKLSWSISFILGFALGLIFISIVFIYQNLQL